MALGWMQALKQASEIKSAPDSWLPNKNAKSHSGPEPHQASKHAAAAQPSSSFPQASVPETNQRLAGARNGSWPQLAPATSAPAPAPGGRLHPGLSLDHHQGSTPGTANSTGQQPFQPRNHMPKFPLAGVGGPFRAEASSGLPPSSRNPAQAPSFFPNSAFPGFGSQPPFPHLSSHFPSSDGKTSPLALDATRKLLEAACKEMQLQSDRLRPLGRADRRASLPAESITRAGEPSQLGPFVRSYTTAPSPFRPDDPSSARASSSALRSNQEPEKSTQTISSARRSVHSIIDFSQQPGRAGAATVISGPGDCATQGARQAGHVEMMTTSPRSVGSTPVRGARPPGAGKGREASSDGEESISPTDKGRLSPLHNRALFTLREDPLQGEVDPSFEGLEGWTESLLVCPQHTPSPEPGSARLDLTAEASNPVTEDERGISSSHFIGRTTRTTQALQEGRGLASEGVTASDAGLLGNDDTLKELLFSTDMLPGHLMAFECAGDVWDPSDELLSTMDTSKNAGRATYSQAASPEAGVGPTGPRVGSEGILNGPLKIEGLEKPTGNESDAPSSSTVPLHPDAQGRPLPSLQVWHPGVPTDDPRLQAHPGFHALPSPSKAEKRKSGFFPRLTVPAMPHMQLPAAHPLHYVSKDAAHMRPSNRDAQALLRPPHQSLQVPCGAAVETGPCQGLGLDGQGQATPAPQGTRLYAGRCLPMPCSASQATSALAATPPPTPSVQPASVALWKGLQGSPPGEAKVFGGNMLKMPMLGELRGDGTTAPSLFSLEDGGGAAGFGDDGGQTCELEGLDSIMMQDLDWNELLGEPADSKGCTFMPPWLGEEASLEEAFPRSQSEPIFNPPYGSCNNSSPGSMDGTVSARSKALGCASGMPLESPKRLKPSFDSVVVAEHAFSPGF